ncbi:MAG: gliding motility-associated C-terminal domain-containing protein [Bacteroidia bacterium]|jgi:hypothetical protein
MRIVFYILFILTVSCKKPNTSDAGLQIYVPNAFYPNSSVSCPDGDPDCNRHFQVSFSDETQLAAYEMRIFDRNQVTVFQSVRYHEGWNGRKLNVGKELNGGIYQVLIKYTDKQNETFIVTKSILLIR